MKLLTGLVCLAALCGWGRELEAAQWYAAPYATAKGNGSKLKPWPLRVALTKNRRIRPGDTLNLLGGTYQGPGFNCTLSGTTNNYITVRSYPGQWAVITDGDSAILAANLDGTTNLVDNVPFTGADFDVNVMLRIDHELLWVIHYNGPGRWTIRRAQWGTRAAPHTNGSIAYITGEYLSQGGSNVVFQDFEITSTILTNRNVDDGSGNTMPGGLSFNGTGNKAHGLIVHNVGEAGIGWTGAACPVELNGCILWGIGMYDPIGMVFGGGTRSRSVTASQSGSMATASAPFFSRK